MKSLVLVDNPYFIVDMMYARSDNIIGRDVYNEIGFGNKAYVHKDLWNALLKIVPFLEKNNFSTATTSGLVSSNTSTRES